MVPEIVPEKREAEPILVRLANKTFTCSFTTRSYTFLLTKD
jgi:hypothetical protein